MTTIWLGLSGFAKVYVSDWVTAGKVSVPVIRSTSAAPNARGVNTFSIAWFTAAVKGEVAEPPSASPQAVMINPAAKFSCLSMPFS